MVPLAKVTKLDVSIDLSRPVEEIVDIISLITNVHAGQQYELLKQVDLKVGEALAAMEKARKMAAES